MASGGPQASRGDASAYASLELRGAPNAAHNRLDGDLRDRLKVLLAQLDRVRSDGSAAELARWLVAFAMDDESCRADVVDLLGKAAGGLAPMGRPPNDDAAGAAWRAVVAAVEELQGGEDAHLLGRRAFVDDGRWARLAAEAAEARPRGPNAGRQADPGPELRRLAVDPDLSAAVARAVEFPVRPAYVAVYQYHGPGTVVRPHVDHRQYEIVAHLVLDHVGPPDRSARSALVSYRAGRPPFRVGVGPGELVVLRGRANLHGWEPMGIAEDRTLTGIVFQPEAG